MNAEARPSAAAEVVIPSAWDVISARAATLAGAKRVFISGSALAGSVGLPDLGLVGPAELVGVARRVVEHVDADLLVDAEFGYGSGPRLARAIEELIGAGVRGVMIEDQDDTGQSVARSPALCEPEEMRRRIEVVRSVAGDRLTILARTDILGADWPFEETLRRLQLYKDAGADEVMAVFVRSREELARVAELAGRGAAIALALPGATGYRPSREDVLALGAGGLLVTGQHMAAMKSLIEIYEQTLAGEVIDAEQRQMSRTDFAHAFDFGRYTQWT